MVEREDLGPGAYVLVTGDGRRLQLAGCDPALVGRAVTVQGSLESDAVGFGMTGDPVLRVERIDADVSH